MRILISILICSVCISCSNNDKDDSVDFPNITINFQTGDWHPMDYQIAIESTESGIIANKITPVYFYGINTDSIWSVKLDSTKLKLVADFINKAQSLNGHHPSHSTSTNIYEVIIQNDTTYNIDGDCDWKGLDYFSIESKLFKDQFADLERKRETLYDSLNTAIIGQWIVKKLSNEIKPNDTVLLFRDKEINNSKSNEIIWTFGDSVGFNSLNNTMFDLSYSKSYKLNVNYGSLHLEIIPGTFTNEKGHEYLGNSGAEFEIISAEPNKIILEYLSR